MKYFAEKGQNIYDATTFVIEQMRDNNENEAILGFNEIDLNVYHDSNPKDIVEKHYLKHTINQLKKV